MPFVYGYLESSDVPVQPPSNPPGFWGPNDPRPTPPIYWPGFPHWPPMGGANPPDRPRPTPPVPGWPSVPGGGGNYPGSPGFRPPGGGDGGQPPLGTWGGDSPWPGYATPPIYLPEPTPPDPDAPHPEHPIVLPPEPPVDAQPMPPIYMPPSGPRTWIVWYNPKYGFKIVPVPKPE